MPETVGVSVIGRGDLGSMLKLRELLKVSDHLVLLPGTLLLTTLAIYSAVFLVSLFVLILRLALLMMYDDELPDLGAAT